MQCTQLGASLRAPAASVSGRSRASAVCAASADASTIKVLKLKAGVKNLPHPDKVEYGGEDGFFVSTLGGGAVGVADGVGGWADSGINPADYSKTFMKNTQKYIESLEQGPAPKDCQDALASAHAETRLPGSSTAVVLSLNSAAKKLSAANVGDSGFMHIRGNQILFRSPPLQHFFDCPLQFGAFPDFVDATDNATDAQLFELDVAPGDVFVTASDGLWDNCFPEEIVQLSPTTPDISAATAAAQKMADLARQHAADRRFKSPYTKEALAQGYDLEWWEKLLNTRIEDGSVKIGELEGGKMDDITVVVAVVAEEDVPVEPEPEPEAAE